MTRIIIHLDIDYFYAQAEEIRRPDLRGRPIAVFQKKLIATSNLHARALGCVKFTSVSDAKLKYPQVILLCGEELTFYRKLSDDILDSLSQNKWKIFKKDDVLVERLGLDDFFIDVTDEVEARIYLGEQCQCVGHAYQGTFESSISNYSLLDVQESHMSHLKNEKHVDIAKYLYKASEVTKQVRDAVFDTYKLTMSGGISTSKLLAKIGGSWRKPNDQSILFPAFAESFIDYELGTGKNKLRKLPGIGFRMADLLNQQFNANDALSARKILLKDLERVFGLKSGQTIFNIVRGIDTCPVVPTKCRKTMSEENSYSFLKEEKLIRHEIIDLLTQLFPRLDEEYRKNKRHATLLRLSVRHSNSLNSVGSERESRSAKLPHIVYSEIPVAERALNVAQKIMMPLFKRLLNGRSCSIQMINIAATNFSIEELQSSSPFIKGFLAKQQLQNSTELTFSISNGPDLELINAGHDNFPQHSCETDDDKYVCNTCGEEMFSWCKGPHESFHLLECSFQN